MASDGQVLQGTFHRECPLMTKQYLNNTLGWNNYSIPASFGLCPGNRNKEGRVSVLLLSTSDKIRQIQVGRRKRDAGARSSPVEKERTHDSWPVIQWLILQPTHTYTSFHQWILFLWCVNNWNNSKTKTTLYCFTKKNYSGTSESITILYLQ